MPLDAEMEAIRASGAALGLWMNWGRSVIETRDAAEATAQIARAHASGRFEDSSCRERLPSQALRRGLE